MTTQEKVRNEGVLKKLTEYIGSNKVIVSQYVIIILLCYIILALLEIGNTIHSTLWKVGRIPSIESNVSEIHNQVVPKKSVWDR